MRRLVDLAGPVDMTANIPGYESLCRDTVITSPLGGTPAKLPERYTHASPIKLLALGIPQVLVIGTHENYLSLPLAPAYTRAATQVEAAILGLFDGRLPPAREHVTP